MDDNVIDFGSNLEIVFDGNSIYVRTVPVRPVRHVTCEVVDDKPASGRRDSNAPIQTTSITNQLH